MGEARPDDESLGVDLLEESAQDARFAFLQANVVLNFALADDWLLDAADGGGARYGRDFDGNFQTNLVVGMDAGRYVRVNADVDVLELRVHEGIDAGLAPCLEASRSNGHAVADAELRRLAIDGS